MRGEGEKKKELGQTGSARCQPLVAKEILQCFRFSLSCPPTFRTFFSSSPRVAAAVVVAESRRRGGVRSTYFPLVSRLFVRTNDADRR